MNLIMALDQTKAYQLFGIVMKLEQNVGLFCILFTEEARFSKMLAGGNISLVVYDPPSHYRGVAIIIIMIYTENLEDFFYIAWGEM